MNMTKRNLMCAASFLGCALVLGCSDDVTSVDNTSLKLSSIEDEKCSDGSLVLDEKSGDVYVCQKSQWNKMFNEADAATCSVKALKDDSGYKILCNGDSVGVVKNGAKGDQGKPGANGKDGSDGSDGKNVTGAAGADGKDGAICKLTSKNDSLKIVCGDSSVVMGFAKVQNESKAYTIKGKIQSITMSSKTKVSIIPLEESELIPVGKNFFATDLIALRQKNSSEGYVHYEGDFEASVESNSRYAKIIIEMKSAMLNRVSVMAEARQNIGTLVSLVDLEDSSTFAVSNFTTVTYDRIVALMSAGKTYKEAKAQAEKELFSAFGLDGKSKSMDSVYVGKFDETDALHYLLGSIEGDGSAQSQDWMKRISQSLGEEDVFSADDIAELRLLLVDDTWDFLGGMLYNQYHGGNVVDVAASPESEEADFIYPSIVYEVNTAFLEKMTGFDHCTEKTIGKVDSVEVGEDKNYFVCAYDGRWAVAHGVDNFPCHEPKDASSALISLPGNWKYVCDVNAEGFWMWSVPADIEAFSGKACTSLNIDDEMNYEDQDYQCTANGWRVIEHVQPIEEEPEQVQPIEEENP